MAGLGYGRPRVVLYEREEFIVHGRWELIMQEPTGGDGSGEGGNDSEDRELIENVLPGEELKNLDSNQLLSGVL